MRIFGINLVYSFEFMKCYWTVLTDFKSKIYSRTTNENVDTSDGLRHETSFVCNDDGVDTMGDRYQVYRNGATVETCTRWRINSSITDDAQESLIVCHFAAK